MLDFSLHLINVFTEPLRNIYTTPMPTLCFFVTPPKLLKADEATLQIDSPCLALVPGNTKLHVEFTPSRRNWVALIDTPDIHASSQPAEIEIRSQDSWHRTPAAIPIEPAFVTAMEREWEEMRDAFLDGLPNARLSARIGVANQLRKLIDYTRPQPEHTPAARLKRLIDSDTKYSRNLEELSNECGLSPDHIRLLFKQAYGVTPNHYRNQRRMATAMDLVAHSDMSIMEIGSHLGCQHMSHFSALFRKEFGMSPRDAVAKFRY